MNTIKTRLSGVFHFLWIILWNRNFEIISLFEIIVDYLNWSWHTICSNNTATLLSSKSKYIVHKHSGYIGVNIYRVYKNRKPLCRSSFACWWNAGLTCDNNKVCQMKKFSSTLSYKHYKVQVEQL